MWKEKVIVDVPYHSNKFINTPDRVQCPSYPLRVRIYLTRKRQVINTKTSHTDSLGLAKLAEHAKRWESVH